MPKSRPEEKAGSSLKHELLLSQQATRSLQAVRQSVSRQLSKGFKFGIVDFPRLEQFCALAER